ncbi:hypothetical protein M0P48_02470 [Candidatus Gracilibacteria bacterium]|nr:hypothetical protein [Candidatus Gracilibacteria bacterium]
MKYIDAITGSLISVVFFIPMSIYINGVGSTPVIETLLTISSFLFAILAGFFISRLNSRYDQIRELISNEDAYFYSLFKTAKVYGKKFADDIAKSIDNYYIACFENELTDYYKHTAPYLDDLYKTLNALKGKNGDNLYANMFSILLSIELVRNKNSVISKERLTKGQWLVLICLAIVILFCLLYINTNQIFFQLIMVLVSAVLVLVLLTLRDLQNLRLGGKLMPVLESGQEVLESIGKLRYYNKTLAKKGIMEIPKEIKHYRLGLHKPGEKANVKIIDK